MARKLGMNGADPKGKGENWPKFLREMQTLGPIIEAKIGNTAPINRGEARAGGRANVKAFLGSEMARLADLQRFRDHKVNEWFDTTMRALAPYLFRTIERLGPDWAFILKLAGWKLKAVDGIERGVPFTLCTVKRYGRLKAGLRMFWEDPKKEGIPHERRR